MCPHAATEAPAWSPASNTTTSCPRSSSCAAAARPIGPAPMIATGNASSPVVDAGVVAGEVVMTGSLG
ncbi:hypothetical protein ACFPRL_35670 [Pseudoclavibacter helvolus]